MTKRPGLLARYRRVLKNDAAAGIVLMIAAAAALVWSNSPWREAYERLATTVVGPGSVHLALPIEHWASDGILTVFFFVVGLELKQEFTLGSLRDPRKAAVPIIAAACGMAGPSAFYALTQVATGSGEYGGWAVPVATDIAFALAILAIFGRGLPPAARTFLMTLAVADDLGGIIVIAIFYSGHVAATPLFIALGVLVFLTVGGRLGIQHALFFYTGFFVVWYLFTQAGIHPTIAGVLVAFTVPARPKVKLDSFADNMRDHLASLDFTQARHAGKSTVLSPGQVLVLTNIHRLAAHTVSPLQSLVERLNPVVNYLILPLFAFVNAGVHFGGFDLSALAGIPLAIFLGLFVGKTIGIFTFSYLAAKARIVSISPEITKRALFGVSILGGIGFTVSLFIANLSFAAVPDIGDELLNEAKLGIFVGSLVSGIVGYFFLKHQLPERD